jgi:hypothetical protein
MLKHWLIDLIGHLSGFSDAQLGEIEKSLPATKALIDLLNRAQPMIEQAQSLYAEAEPLIDQGVANGRPRSANLDRCDLASCRPRSFAGRGG